ncbi:hypothetical protein C5T95_29940 [Raoultella ornithinolytica]|uniref:hypothetical protein n=1 Tax=Raoultella ornithinolytica TaxID=54291 RepID=UPI000CF316B3|nr:hypothetical protein [Raoultella ornithinolytica]PQH17171.1 hypothetical protein C5T95_29940 [Raoultella ornithinolytica]
MGATIFTNNAFSSISDPDNYSPGFDVTGLQRSELFTYTGIGINLMPGVGESSVVGTPVLNESSPYATFYNNASQGYINTGVTGGNTQTWFLLFDPAGNTSQRLVMSSYAGSSSSALPGEGIMVNESGALQFGLGYHNTSSGAYAVTFVTLDDFNFSTKSLLCVTLNGTTATIQDLSHGLTASVTLSSGRERAPNGIRVGKGAVSLWGSNAATSKIAAYLIFNRILASDEKEQVRNYLQKCIQAKFPEEVL